MGTDLATSRGRSSYAVTANPTNQQGTEIVGRSGEWASAVNRSNGRRGQRNRPNALTLGDIFRRGARGSHRSQSACCCLIIRLLTAGKCLCY